MRWRGLFDYTAFSGNRYGRSAILVALASPWKQKPQYKCDNRLYSDIF